MLPTSIMVSFNDFQQQTLDIVESFVHCSVDDSWTSRTSIVTAILQLVDEFNKTCVSKNVFDETWCALSDYKGFCKHYEKILDQVFLDVNWGRIIAMFAMLSDFAQRLNQEQQHNLLHQLVLDTSTFVSSRLYDFISKHGGWEGLLAYGTEERVCDVYVENLKKCVYGAAGAIGVVAFFGFISSRI